MTSVRATLYPLAFATLIFLASGASAQTPSAEPALTPEQEQLVERLKAEIMKELTEGEFLQQQIQLAIEAFVQKQRQAQADAQAQQAEQAQARAKNVRRVSAERDHIYGNPDAVVSLIEYSDFECPYCKRFHATARSLVEQYDGKVNWVYRHFPLNFHNPGAQKQAEASECAAELGGNDLFWKYTDTIYERTTSGGRGFPIDALVPLAEELGLDGGAFRTCLDSGKYTQRVLEDFAEGGRIGITGTPGNVLLHNESGDVQVRPGAVPLASLKADVEKLLQ